MSSSIPPPTRTKKKSEASERYPFRRLIADAVEGLQQAALMRGESLSYRALEEQSGLPSGTLSRFIAEARRRTVQASTLARLSKGLGLDNATLIDALKRELAQEKSPRVRGVPLRPVDKDQLQAMIQQVYKSDRHTRADATLVEEVMGKPSLFPLFEGRVEDFLDAAAALRAQGCTPRTVGAFLEFAHGSRFTRPAKPPAGKRKR